MINNVQFKIDIKDQTGLDAYFLQNDQHFRMIHLYGGEEIEFWVGQNPISESVSGSVWFVIEEKVLENNDHPFTIQYKGNVQREGKYHCIYDVLDKIKQTLESAINKGEPCIVNITEELLSTGWKYTCADR